MAAADQMGRRDGGGAMRRWDRRLSGITNMIDAGMDPDAPPGPDQSFGWLLEQAMPVLLTAKKRNSKLGAKLQRSRNALSLDGS
jgi:hypothetical protein